MKVNWAFIISTVILFALLFPIMVGTESTGVSGQLAPRSTYSPGDPYTTLYYPPTEVSPPNYAKQPIVTILSPENGTVIVTNSTILDLFLTLEASNSSRPVTLGPVLYKASWMSNNITVDSGVPQSPFLTKTIPLSIDLANMSEGTQSVTVYAYALCEYESGREQVSVSNDPWGILVFKYLNIYYNTYKIGGFSSVSFTFDTIPKISVLSPINQRYNDSSVPLASVVDKLVNWTGYSLDGKQNVTITGDTSLSGLSSGMHNITVYAKDLFGNVGSSETITFIVAVPFPLLPVAAVSVAVIVLVAAGLLVYHKKHKHNLVKNS
jgi:hypothetical protein